MTLGLHKFESLSGSTWRLITSYLSASSEACVSCSFFFSRSSYLNRIPGVMGLVGDFGFGFV